jgi:hypothetical protein
MRSPRGQVVGEVLVSAVRSPLEETELTPHPVSVRAAGESVSRRRKRVSAIIGKIRADSKPAAMSAAPVAFVINPSSLPIWVAATMKDSEVACNSPAATQRRVPTSGRREQSGQSPHDEQRGQEDRHAQDGSGTGKVRRQVELQATRHEKDRDKDAESDGFELLAKLRVKATSDVLEER